MVGIDVRQKFGERLRALRLAKGFSQEQFAERCNLHRTYVGGIERGERNSSLKNIVTMATALDESPAAFYDWWAATSDPD